MHASRANYRKTTPRTGVSPRATSDPPNLWHACDRRTAATTHRRRALLDFKPCRWAKKDIDQRQLDQVDEPGAQRAPQGRCLKCQTRQLSSTGAARHANVPSYCLGIRNAGLECFGGINFDLGALAIGDLATGIVMTAKMTPHSIKW